jgi:hypothetical protein
LNNFACTDGACDYMNWYSGGVDYCTAGQHCEENLGCVANYSCARCSNMFGCTWSTFESEFAACDPVLLETVTYTQSATCDCAPLDNGGDNNNCIGIRTCP